MGETKRVTIYPTGEAYIPGVPAIEQEVDAKRAEELLAYSPAAFTTKKSDAAEETRLYVEQSTQLIVEETAPEEAPAEPQGSKE